MKQIPLNSKKYPGIVAIVSDEDYELVKNRKWNPRKVGKYTFYVGSTYYNDDNKARVLQLHRLIMGLAVGDKREVDHINGNGLDNRRCNLRVVTHTQNTHNSQSANKSSKYKGVSRKKGNKMWTAQIRIGDKTTRFGTYDNEEEAARAYDNAAIKYHGEYVRLNFPETPIDKIEELPGPTPQATQYTCNQIGVGYHKATDKWQASITANKKKMYLGIFNDINNAILVRQLAEKVWHK